MSERERERERERAIERDSERQRETEIERVSERGGRGGDKEREYLACLMETGSRSRLCLEKC